MHEGRLKFHSKVGDAQLLCTSVDSAVSHAAASQSAYTDDANLPHAQQVELQLSSYVKSQVEMAKGRDINICLWASI